MPATDDVIALLKQAVEQGRIVVLPTMPDQRSIAHALAYPPEPPIVVACCMTFGLRRAEARALIRLMESEFVSREELHAVISRSAKSKIVDVIVCHLRKKVAGHGITIETIWAQG